MKSITPIVIGGLSVLLFGPLVLVFYLWLEGQSTSTSSSGLVISLSEDIDNKFRGKWYYRFFSFLVHKKEESFLANLIRFLVFDLPFNIVIYGILVVISVVWTLSVFRILFHIDLGPFFVTLLYSR